MVRAGYKQTEAGSIPKDWNAVALGEAAKWKGGITPSMSNPDFWAGGNIPWVSSGDVKKKRLSETAFNITDNAIRKTSSVVFPSGTLLIVTRSGILRKYFPVAVSEVPLAINQDIKAGVVRDGICAEYLLQSLTWHGPKVLSDCLKSGTTVESIEFSWFKSFAVPVPQDAKEQQAIAEALSDADGLIGSLEKLIAKKRRIKQGVMQELLTGKKRLPGFRKEWTKVLLGQIAKIQTGSRNNEDKVEDGVYPFFVRSPNVERINTYSYECEAILVPGEGNIGNIFHYGNGRFDLHQRVYGVRQFIDSSCGKFIYYYMLKFFGHHALQNTVKATVDSLRLPTFENFSMHIPSEKAEQAAIAEALSDIDSELSALEQKLAKARQIKQGMMQELLTGRIRLI